MRAANFLVLITLLGGVCLALLLGTANGWSAVWAYRELFWRGWLTTIWLSAIALVLSFAIGLAAALLRRSKLLIARDIAILYVEIVRGTPLLVQLLFFFYVVAAAVHIDDRYTAGIIVLSMFSGAYAAEMIRAGIESVGATQWESARAIGLTTLQTYRLVVFPQALRQLLPPFAGQAASIIKDSSLLMILGIPEFTLSAQQVNSATYSTLESYLPLGVGYLILTLPISIFARQLEARFQYEH